MSGRDKCSGKQIKWGKEIESVRGAILDQGVKKGLFKEVPRAEASENGGSKPCECLKMVQCREKSSAEPLEDGKQEMPSFDEVFKDGEVMTEQTRPTSGEEGGVHLGLEQERADGGSVGWQ